MWGYQYRVEAGSGLPRPVSRIFKDSQVFLRRWWLTYHKVQVVDSQVVSDNSFYFFNL